MKRLLWAAVLFSTVAWAQHSAGPAPNMPSHPDGSTASRQIVSAPGYGVEAANGFYAEFDTLTPGTLINAGLLTLDGGFPGAGDFAGLDLDHYYVGTGNNNVWVVDRNTGAETLIGAATLNGAETFSGFAWDSTTATMFAVGTDISQASLYAVNLTTGAATSIGTFATMACTIALACDPTGQLWAYDICDDNLYTINKATAAETLVGSIGFDANFGQGMDYDEVNGQLVMTAFNSTTFQPELRLVNPATGATTFEGVIGDVSPGGLCQLASFGFAESRVSIPTLSQWGLIAFALALTAVAVFLSIRRRRAHS